MFYLTVRKKEQPFYWRGITNSLALLVMLGLLLSACVSQKEPVASPETGAGISPEQQIQEIPIIDIPLAGPLSTAKAEISGMAWYGEHVFLLPQYPNRFRDDEGNDQLFYIPKAAILSFLGAESTDSATAILPSPVPLHYSGKSPAEQIAGFQGYEALAFVENRVFLLVEARYEDGMTGYVVQGEIEPDLSQITITGPISPRIPPQSEIGNMSYESLLVLPENQLLILYEANGAQVNSTPFGQVFDGSLQPVHTMTLATVEYRMTDATTLDATGRFWAINTFWTGDKALSTTSDPIAGQFGRGKTHAESRAVERLIELEITGTEIALSGTPPIQLQLDLETGTRNWEGLVRFHDQNGEYEGFLLVTDQHPSTMLGFVAYP